MTVYYECSGDERVPQVIYKTLRNYYDLLSSGTIKLFDWGKHRWYECFIAIRFLKERYQEEWIDDLGRILKEQGFDYGEAVETWKRPLNKWTQYTHIVNLAMMLKAEAVSCDILKESYTDRAEYFYEILDKYNGTPVGLFTGDECLSGLSPIQGTELCAVAEQMYSYELLYAYTGDKKWAERLEVLAFNALPATISDDMWAHQYVQMSNQIACQKFPGRSLFRTNDSEAHLFGLEPNFGCCTANFNQAWPKFALSAFMHNENTIVSAVPVPAELKTDDVCITLETEYPFKNELVYRIDAGKAVQLVVRIPSFAENVKIDGETVNAAEEQVFDVYGKKEIRITFETTAHYVERPYQLKSVKCGSLIFSLPIKYEKVKHEYEKDGVERKYPYCDYEYVGKSDWNYGYCGEIFSVERKPVDKVPFSSENPPVILKTSVRKIPWGLEDGFETVCAKVPESLEPIGEAEIAELYPYGCAKLRMTELPMVKD